LQAGGLLKGSTGAFSAVTAALAAVDRGKNLLQQSEVDAMAQAILDAVAGLEKSLRPHPHPPPPRRRLLQTQGGRPTPKRARPPAEHIALKMTRWALTALHAQVLAS